MSKQNKAGLAYSDATPAQIAAAKQIIEDAAKHRYYVSRIYGMYNAVSGKNEAPQTCSSCLRARAREIKKWYDEGAKDAAKVSKPAKAAKTDDKTVTDTKAAKEADKAAQATADANKVKATDITEEQAKAADLDPNGLPAPAKGVHRIPMEEENVFVDFTPNDGAAFENGVKGIAAYVDGKKVNAGTYKTAQGHTLKVQVGGKATFIEYDPNDLAS